MRLAAVVLGVCFFLSVVEAGSATHPEAAESVRTISRVAGAATWVEMYRFAYGVLPVAKTTSELSDAVGLEPQFLVDGWGRPLSLELDAKGNHYTIRGSNGIVATDGVLQPGLEEWLRKLGVDAGALGAAVADSKAQRTSFSMRELSLLLEAYKTDHGRYPAARDNAHLIELLRPYRALESLDDAWGTELNVVISADGATNEIVSAGSDRTFDRKSWASGGTLTDTGADAVLRNGEFVRLWQERDLSGAVRDAVAVVKDLNEVRANGASERERYARTIRNSRVYRFRATRRPVQALEVYAAGTAKDPLTDEEIEDFLRETALPSDASAEDLQRFMAIAEGVIGERLQSMSKESADALLQKVFHATESHEPADATVWGWRTRLASLPAAGPESLSWFVNAAASAAERKDPIAQDVLAAAASMATRIMAINENDSLAAGARVDLLEAMLEQTTDGPRREELLRELEVVRKERARRVEGKRLEKK
jgi:hypothetical protein